MNIIKQIGQYLLVGILFVVMLPFILLAALVALLAIPFDRRTAAKLPQELIDRWIPDQKYLFISYNDGDEELAGYVEKKLNPKYGKYIVWSAWEWDTITHDKKYAKAGPWIQRVIIRAADYECAVVGIDRNGKAKTLFIVELEGDYDTLREERMQEIEDVIQKHLQSLGVKY